MSEVKLAGMMDESSGDQQVGVLVDAKDDLMADLRASQLVAWWD